MWCVVCGGGYDSVAMYVLTNGKTSRMSTVCLGLGDIGNHVV